MPHLRFRAVSADTVSQLSQELPTPLAAILHTTPDNFTFEQVSTQYFSAGVRAESYPFVEVWWFQRSQEVQDAAALFITEALQSKVPHQDIVVTFYDISKSNYYENGRHF